MILRTTTAFKWQVFAWLTCAWLMASVVFTADAHAQDANDAKPTGTQSTSTQPVTASSSAEQGSEQINQTPDSARKPSNESLPTKTKPRSKKDKEIFRPSEEISEDFAVPFPVDI